MAANATNGTFMLPDISTLLSDITFNDLWQSVIHFLLNQGFRILIVLVLLFFLMRLVKISLRHTFRILSKGRDMEHAKRLETLHTVSLISAKAALMTLAAVLILGELGISLGPLLATAGVVGIAVGFGAQHLVQDVISGFFLLLDDQIRVGDVVQLGDKSGVVEHINLRLTILRSQNGNVHYIPNGQISVVTNMTKDYSYFLLDMGVAYREDADEVMQVIKEVGEGLRQDDTFGPDILEPVEMLGVDRFADSSVVIRARLKTKPVRQWAVGREMNRRLKRRFDELGIEIPFPHITLYPGVDKEGKAPPLRVCREEATAKPGSLERKMPSTDRGEEHPSPVDPQAGEGKDSREVKEREKERQGTTTGEET